MVGNCLLLFLTPYLAIILILAMLLYSSTHVFVATSHHYSMGNGKVGNLTPLYHGEWQGWQPHTTIPWGMARLAGAFHMSYTGGVTTRVPLTVQLPPKNNKITTTNKQKNFVPACTAQACLWPCPWVSAWCPGQGKYVCSFQ